MKKYKPTTAGLRGMTSIEYRKVLTTQKPFKPLLSGLKKTSGRNNQGRITTRHKGGRVKRSYRHVDFLYIDKINIPAKVETIEYDPNRSAFISLIVYKDGERRYILSYKGAKVGDILTTSLTNEVKDGNRTILKQLPVGTFIYNVETKPRGGAKMGRSAGAFIQVVAQDEGKTSLKMPSGEIRKVSDQCFASVGEVSNSEHRLVNLGKAGRSRKLGIRPTVRGSAMNPVDHAHGGGEGRQPIGLRRGPKTFTGKLAFGVKTRKAKKYSDKFIVKRRQSKRDKKNK